jgi:hypothetical protein
VKSKTAVVVAASALAITAPLAAQTTVGEVFATDASVRGSLVMTAGGTHVLSGSQVAAGENVALLRLLRGGEVRICRGTSVAINEQDVGAPMLFGINTGSLELHYPLTAISDSVVTPDFRIQVTGPGISNVALGSDAKGNTCIKSMAGNSSSIIVSEMMGEGTYNVAQGRSVVFREGKLEQVSDSDGVCGCPVVKPAEPAMEVAKNVPIKPVAPDKASATPSIVEMDAPLVFAGNKTAKPETEREQLIREGYTIATLRVRPVEIPQVLQPSGMPVQKKAEKAAGQKKGFWHFFAKLFGG